MTSIARFFGLSPAIIAEANQLANNDRLVAGQVLTIPPTPPPQLTVTPEAAPPGHVFTFTLTGVKVGETVIIEIVNPSGGIFTGQPHTAPQEGTVTASYISSGDGPGSYRVVATGDRGTSMEASYRILG